MLQKRFFLFDEPTPAQLQQRAVEKALLRAKKLWEFKMKNTDFTGLFATPKHELLSVKQCAAFLGCSTQTMRKIIKANDLKIVKFCNAVNAKARIVAGDLQSFVEKNFLNGEA